MAAEVNDKYHLWLLKLSHELRTNCPDTARLLPWASLVTAVLLPQASFSTHTQEQRQACIRESSNGCAAEMGAQWRNQRQACSRGSGNRRAVTGARTLGTGTRH